jgi:SAM-dependent methyltransferase
MGLHHEEMFYRNPNPSARVWNDYPDPRDIPPQIEGPMVLDAGCGNGRNLPLLASLGMEAVGLEINDDLVRSASRRGDVVQSSVTSIPFRDDAFDTSLVGGVLWYVKDFAGAHSELSRVCRKRYTWSYAKFFRLPLLKPRNLFYFLRRFPLGRIYPRRKSTLLAYGRIVSEDEAGYVLVSGRDREKQDPTFRGLAP